MLMLMMLHMVVVVMVVTGLMMHDCGRVGAILVGYDCAGPGGRGGGGG